jgi:hypothetical protein
MQWAKRYGIQAAQNQPIYRIFKEQSVRLGAEMFGSGQFPSGGLGTTAEALDPGKIETGYKLPKSHWREQENHSG